MEALIEWMPRKKLDGAIAFGPKSDSCLTAAVFRVNQNTITEKKLTTHNGFTFLGQISWQVPICQQLDAMS